MNRTLKYAQLTSIYPAISKGGSLSGGRLLGQCQKCLRCQSRECREFSNRDIHTGVEHLICPYGLSVFAVGLDGETLVINGMVDTDLNNKCPKRLRKTLRNHFVHIHQIREWRASVLRLVAEITREIELGVTESVSSLHDIKTAVSLVYRNAEGLISELPGASFDEKAENATPKLQSLLKAMGLLETRMSMASIVANPESAAYGTKKPTAVYKLFHKFCHLFEEHAGHKGVRVAIKGRSVRKPLAYDSLETLAMVLIDNAVKYSTPHEDVTVEVNDSERSARGVLVDVTSIGPIVPNNARERIFRRGYRCPAAKEFAATGSGLGLYIATVIAEAHGSRIDYFGIPFSENSEIGRNVFSFHLL